MYHYPLLLNLDIGFTRSPYESFGNLLFQIDRTFQEAKLKKKSKYNDYMNFVGVVFLITKLWQYKNL